ncbi:Sugar phosphate isomerase/epimerase [Planctomycetales bacterium 10988]|nr:Sugar phosphate isomerase/epimerase [Planctomycetales bacterium 10988]
MNTGLPDRRTFLQAAGGSLAAGSLLSLKPTLCQAAELKTAHTLHAVKGGTIGEDETAMIARLRELKHLGFDGLEADIPGVPDLKALKNAIKKADFPVHGIINKSHRKYRLSDPDPKVRELGREGLAEAIRGAHFLGATSVLLVPGRVKGPEENHQHVWERSIPHIRKVAPLAQRLGISILVENVWNGFCETPEEFRDYLDEIGHPAVGAYFDIGNCRKFGPSEDWIRTLGKRIVKLDVKDWGKDHQERNGFCRLGEGDVNWPEVNQALAEFSFHGWATREGVDRDEADTSKLMDQLLPV